MLSNPEDRKKLLNAIKEIDNSMTRVAAERDFQKDAITAVADALELEKKYVRKLASIYHKQNFTQVQQEQEEVETLYELIAGSSDEQSEQ
jgi:NADH:ubiquinone oxidoreductase subunit E